MSAWVLVLGLVSCVVLLGYLVLAWLAWSLAASSRDVNGEPEQDAHGRLEGEEHENHIG